MDEQDKSVGGIEESEVAPVEAPEVGEETESEVEAE